MIPWEELDRVPVAGGGDLTLHRRGDELSIRAGGQELMNSRRHDSEEALAVRGCADLAAVPGARVLVAGLGMGFTVRASLDLLGRTARIDVVELVPAVVLWNRGPLAHLAARPLEDTRVRVIESDVADVLAGAPATYDAILMDVDNGPRALTSAANARLYTLSGLTAAARALKPAGTYAIWSPADHRSFTQDLRRAGFDARTEEVPARRGSGGRHVLWIARLKPSMSKS